MMGAVMVVSALLAARLLAFEPYPLFEAYGPYDPAVPKPESLLGYGPGERHTVYRDQERVVLAIAEKAKSRVKVFEFGKSVEGRPLRLLAISSPKNIARLEAIRKAIGELANPKPDGDYSELIADTPPLVWINECIHGDETASFESAMWLLYNLAASRDKNIERQLENAVMLLNPVYNPDGHERYVVWYNGVSVGSGDPSAFEHNAPAVARGRGNHYRFDLNRDRIALSQDETRAEVAEFLRWNPQVYVDQHGQVENYFFPPNPMAINVNVDRARLDKWVEIFGKATAAAFDKQGWLYFIKKDFDLYYPGYLDSWASLNGAVGMTHETDHGASIRLERRDGSPATLRGAMEKHFTSALAVFRASAERRRELLTDFLRFKRNASSGERAGRFRFVALERGTFDEAAMKRLLDRHGIRYREVDTFFHDAGTCFWTGRQGPVSFPAGALIVDMAQPMGPLAKALFEPQSDFEPEFVAEQLRRRELARAESPDPDAGNYEFYDTTAWSLVYGFGARAWWFSEPAKPSGELRAGSDWRPLRVISHGDSADAGYAVLPASTADVLAVAKAAAGGLRVHYTTRGTFAGRTYLPPGSLLLLRGRNGTDFDQRVKALSEKCRLVPLQSAYPAEGREGLGSDSVEWLRTPKLAVVFGDPSAPSAFGSAWYVLEREFDIPFTPITTSSLSRDLSKFSCIVFPPGRYTITSELREWLQEGGCAVVLGNPAWMLGDSGFAKLDVTKVDGEEPTDLPGAFYLGLLDARSFLSYGLPSDDEQVVNVAVPVSGSAFYKSGSRAESVLTMPSEAARVRLLSGWSWPGETEKALAGTVWAHVTPVGRGRVVMFMWNPTERAMWPAHWRLMLNAILFGPR